MKPCDYHSELSGKVDTLVSQMGEVHTAICGDEELGHRGLVRRVRDLEVVKISVDRRSWYRKGFYAAIGGMLVLIWDWAKIKFKCL